MSDENLKLTKQEAQEVIWEDSERFSIVEDKIIGTSRWAVQHEVIVTDEPGRFYRAYYQVGATEQQEEAPFEYEDEVDFVRVYPHEVTTTVYKVAEPVKQ